MKAPRLAVEAGAFSVLAALLSLLVADASPGPDALQGPAAYWGVAAIAQTAVFAWAAVEPAEAAPDAHVPAESRSPPAPDLAPFADAPVFLMSISALGRIRAATGDASLAPKGAAPGRMAEAALGFDPRDEASGGGRRAAPWREDLEIAWRPAGAGGAVVAVYPSGAEALRRAQDALDERTAFFASLSHDLRTPLNAIINFADMIKSEIRGPLPEHYKSYAGLIEEGGWDLLMLVDDILDIAKSESGRLRLEVEPVELGASAQSVVHQLKDVAARRGVTLRLKAPEEVWAEADPRAVRQIWQNLVSNAVKYSEQGGVVSLGVRTDGGAAVLSVRDRGAGMDRADLERVSRPFAQGENAKGRHGTGLGLAVVRRFAELHGGQAIIDTAPGEGTRVQVTLPLADPAAFSEAAQ